MEETPHSVSLACGSVFALSCCCSALAGVLFEVVCARPWLGCCLRRLGPRPLCGKFPTGRIPAGAWLMSSGWLSRPGLRSACACACAGRPGRPSRSGANCKPVRPRRPMLLAVAGGWVRPRQCKAAIPRNRDRKARPGPATELRLLLALALRHVRAWVSSLHRTCL